MARLNWTRDQLLVAFNLYFRIPFGRMHGKNPEIIQLANYIGRTPDALAMKLCNLASLDPEEQARKIKGLKGASQLDREIWAEFHSNWEQLAFESEIAIRHFSTATPEELERIPVKPLGATEAIRKTRVRLVQRFFRQAVLSSYGSRCAVCLIPERRLLIASHIIPWRDNEERRADPSNGLSLCSLHDRAFDQGLISVDDSLRLLVSYRLKTKDAVSVQRAAFHDLEGQTLCQPLRFDPDPAALEYHRSKIFEQRT